MPDKLLKNSPRKALSVKRTQNRLHSVWMWDVLTTSPKFSFFSYLWLPAGNSSVEMASKGCSFIESDKHLGSSKHPKISHKRNLISFLWWRWGHRSAQLISSLTFQKLRKILLLSHWFVIEVDKFLFHSRLPSAVCLEFASKNKKI